MVLPQHYHNNLFFMLNSILIKAFISKYLVTYPYIIRTIRIYV